MLPEEVQMGGLTDKRKSQLIKEKTVALRCAPRGKAGEGCLGISHLKEKVAQSSYLIV